MRIHSVLRPILCVFFLFFHLCHISITTSTPRYIPRDHIAINCGASGNFSKAGDRRTWIGDIKSDFAPVDDEKSLDSTPEAQASVDAVPFLTARISYFPFTYEFSVTPGPKFVRLYFYPAKYSSFANPSRFNRTKGYFTVKAGSSILIADLRPSSLVDESLTLMKEFCIVVDEDNKKLKLTISPLLASFGYYAFINGIEIVSMPNDLYYDLHDYSPGRLYIGQNVTFQVSKRLVLETFYRLNVGGSRISPMEDTGMFREWSNDSNYRFGDPAFNTSDPSLIPIYTRIGNLFAPDDVYRSALSMGPNNARNLLSNLTWGLPVELGFPYLVRLHFCEIDPEITEEGERPFIIYIDDLIADQNADVISWSGGTATPCYRDYVVLMEQKDQRVKGIDALWIALHPRKTTYAINNAILNGVEVFKLSYKNGTPAEPSPLPASTMSNIKNTIIIATGCGGGLLIVLTFLWFMVFSKLRKTKSCRSYSTLSKCWCFANPAGKRKSTGKKSSSAPDEFCRHFSLDEIKTATQNFNEELIVGAGGFGNVFKGLIDKGSVTVAIKRLNRESRQGVYEFRTEIEMLSRLRHVHLVSLIGYCEEQGEMILIYDYMANGTLRDHLYNIDKNPFTWKERLKICIGAARGLHYLHTGSKHPIIHRDVKTTNILLDKEWVAKVSDFGLSKFSVDSTEVSTMVKGTWGYLDPDYARRQKLSEKSDVYSFGVVLWEVLCARKALDQKLEEEEQWNLANWVTKCIEKGCIGEIIDPYLKGKIAPESFKVYVEVAEGCVRERGIQRPAMDDVMEKLRFALELQENADAGTEIHKPAGGQTYPKSLSYHYTVQKENMSESGSGSGLTKTTTTTTTTTSESMTRPTHNSDTITSREEGTEDSPIEIGDSSH